MRDLRCLHLSWLIPWSPHRHWASKPLEWIAHMLGTEVEGSAAHVLKRRGWLQKLTTGPPHHPVLLQ